MYVAGRDQSIMLLFSPILLFQRFFFSTYYAQHFAHHQLTCSKVQLFDMTHAHSYVYTSTVCMHHPQL